MLRFFSIEGQENPLGGFHQVAVVEWGLVESGRTLQDLGGRFPFRLFGKTVKGFKKRFNRLRHIHYDPLIIPGC